MKNSSFSIFLNIIFGFLLVGSISFSYIFGNFGGISIKELNDGYLLKKELRFSDLSASLQKRYIDRKKFKTKNSQNTPLKVFDDDGNPLFEDVEEFKEIVNSLKNRVTFLERQNIIISTDKSELLKIVAHEKSKNSTKQKALLSNNLEKINEAEQQHYKNISELTKKINDLQRENINLSQQLNKKDDSSKDMIDSVKKQINEQNNLAIDREEKLKKSYDIKFSTLQSENNSLIKQVKESTNKLKSQQSTTVLELAKKDQRITLLENKINKMLIDKNSMLTKNSQDILKIENYNSKKLEEFNNIIKNSSSEKDAIKEEYKKTLTRVEDKYKLLINSKKDEIQILTQKLSDEKQNSVIVLENSQKEILKNKKENTNKVSKITQKNKIKADELILKTEDLTQELKSLQSKEKRVLSELESKKIAIVLDKDKISQLQAKIKKLQSNERIVDDEVNGLVLQNEEKHNKNYKILNHKIAVLEMDVKSQQETKAKVVSNFNTKKTELINQLSSATDNNKKKDILIEELKKDISKVEKKKKELEQSEHEKLASIRQSFDDLKSSIDLREKNYESKIKTLKIDISNKDIELSQKHKDKKKLGQYVREITSLKKILKEMDSGKKVLKIRSTLEKLGKVECGDMVSGNFKISSTCKAKVEKFLNQYDNTYYFEVIPIIGTGGFASLNKVKRDGRLGIPDSEIKRLTRLSNIGLGRDRAKEGGWLIRDRFGDDVKISYTVYSIESKSKRGFVIRAYR